jgi:hypothetical protein
MWAKRGNTNVDEVYAGNLDFVRQVIMKDDKVCEIMERKWESVQQEYPHSTRKKFEEFWTRLWSSWVREKKKLATRKVNEVRKKSKRKERNAPSCASGDSPGGHSNPATTPSNRTMPPQNPTQSPQSPPIASVVEHNNESMTEIIVKTSQKVRAETPTASNFPLLPPSDSITPKARSADTPSSDSSALTPCKRSYDEMFASTSIGSLRTAPTEFVGNSEVAGFLAKQLKDNLVKGCLSRRAVLKVLEDLEMDEFFNLEESGQATDRMIEGIIFPRHNTNSRNTRQ